MDRIIIIPLFVLIIILIVCIQILRKTKRNKAIVFLELTIILTFSIGLIVFFIGLLSCTEPYYKAIDPLDSGYQPYALNHILTIITLAILGITSTIAIWRIGRKSPPLTLALSIAFMFSFSILLIPMMIQVSEQDMFFMWIAPIIYIITSILLIVKLVKEEANVSTERQYKNKVLNYFNQKLAHSKNYGIWLIITLLPVFLLIFLILILLGQEYDSIVKVFTETTTWTYSAKTHPPYLQHEGHYLCTVAACGTPKVVKPKRLGTRHGNTIIVNRQLMIANAFEELIQEKFKYAHKILRRFYDKYGYPISKNINSELLSNITYIVMKPLEWLFLINLYLFSFEPEKRINKQYQLK